MSKILEKISHDFSSVYADVQNLPTYITENIVTPVKKTGVNAINGTRELAQKINNFEPLGVAANIATIPLIRYIASNVTELTANFATYNAQHTLFADHIWLHKPRVLEAIQEMGAEYPKNSIGLLDFNKVTEIPYVMDYVEPCRAQLTSVLNSHPGKEAFGLIKEFNAQCSGPDAFTGNRLELFVDHLGTTATKVGDEIVRSVGQVIDHPVEKWLNGIGFGTRMDGDTLKQIGVRPEAVLGFLAFATAFYLIDAKICTLAEGKSNPVANLYNRPTKDMGNTAKLVRYSIDALFAAGSIAAIAGVVEALR